MDESKFLGISFRGWITAVVIGTICYMAIRVMEVKEPLYSIALFVVGFYFGQKPVGKNGNGTTNGGESNGNGTK